MTIDQAKLLAEVLPEIVADPQAYLQRTRNRIDHPDDRFLREWALKERENQEEELRLSFLAWIKDNGFTPADPVAKYIYDRVNPRIDELEEAVGEVECDMKQLEQKLLALTRRLDEQAFPPASKGGAA